MAEPVTQAIVGLGTCVDVRGGKTKNGTPVQLYPCNGGKPQTWTWTGTTFQALGKCLDVEKSGTKDKTKVQLWGCNGSAAQDWTAGENGSLVDASSGRCWRATSTRPSVRADRGPRRDSGCVRGDGQPRGVERHGHS